MSLQLLSFPHVLDTSSGNPIEDFFVPALGYAVQYDRGVGYFSSAWLRLAARGLLAFAHNGGLARWITSPILAPADWEALQMGVAASADPILHSALRRNIEELAYSLERDTLSALAWMVADGLLTFKLALPVNKLAGGDFHDKFGVLVDPDGNRIAFMGSHNESVQGTINSESFSLFASWHRAVLPYVDSIQQRFDRLWANEEANVRVYDLPEAAREQIVRLREEKRPYSPPRHLREPQPAYQLAQPYFPTRIQLRDYQEKAIDAWFDKDCQGLFEMATGTGKTITALAASARLFEREQQLAVIITVPYQHLVDQWREEAARFGYKPILAYQSKGRWLNTLNDEIVAFNGRYRPFISVITTHTTFISPDFQAAIARLQAPSLIIADEAHHLGAERSRQSYPHHIPYRLALSATPDRWFDDVGTEILRAYFGKTVFAFTLEEAIGVSLTPYYYYPHLVPLTDDEMVEYEALSIKIARLVNNEEIEKQERLEKLLIKRARLLNTAVNKLQTLSELIDREPYLEHALFYCAPGQINDVIRSVGWDKGVMISQFTAEEKPKERQQLLSDFANGTLQALAAMKCLDEGVDVPSTRIAYFLSSSSNPREFIQRRGRILRKSPGKEYSIIHDLITVPPIAVNKESFAFSVERSIVRRELQRFKEFANPALNKHQALDVIWDLAGFYGLLDF